MGKADAAMGVDLIETEAQLLLELGSVSSTCAKNYTLSGQFDGRRNGFEKREYKAAQVGNKFRDKHGKICKWPKKGESKLQCTHELVSKMIAADVGREAPATAPLPKNLVRRPHTIARSTFEAG
jgi:hypothetical protein